VPDGGLALIGDACHHSIPVPASNRFFDVGRRTAEPDLKGGGVDGSDEDAPADQAQTFARFSSSGGWGDLSLDLRSEFGFGAREVIGHLKAQPDRRRAAEIAGEAQRGFRRNRSLAANDLAYSRGR
jgi:hypothetical protein